MNNNFDASKPNDAALTDAAVRADTVVPSGGLAHRLRTSRSHQVGAGLIALAFIVVTVWLSRGRETTPVAPVQKAASSAATDSMVTLDSTAQRIAGIQLVTAAGAAGDALLANGTITYNADRVAVIAPRADGRIIGVLSDLGQEVSAGQVLATIESPDVSQTRGDLERARATVSVAKRNYEREKRLFEQEISPQKEMLDAEVVYRSSEADFNSALAKLQTYGATTGTGGGYGLRAPVAGTVVERNASPGQIVGPASNVFTVADLRHVWIAVDVYERDLNRVHKGAAVAIAATALPGERFKGRVTFAGGVVDTTSRTIKLRVTVENEARRLRPGMFAQVRIAAPSGAVTNGTIALPEVAVQDMNGKPTVFVNIGPGRYVARTVTIGARLDGGTVYVTGGVRAGEVVVVQGAFQLKSELMKASLGGE